MIRHLRSGHFQIWILLAFLLPLALILAVTGIPGQVYDNLIQPGNVTPLPNIIGTIDKPGYIVHLRTSDKHELLQLEWISKEPITLPSALIYQGEDIDSMGISGQSNLVGRIDARGNYHFALSPGKVTEHLHFLIYDIIHHRVVDRFNF